MTGHPIKRRFLWLINHTLNRITGWLARRGHGPFSLVRHAGRKTGTVYETPLILARIPKGFVAELTYGPEVDWYRNIVAAGHCEVVYKGKDYVIDRIEPYSAAKGLAAFGNPRKQILKLLRRSNFRLLHESAPPTADPRNTS